ncbi:cytochrome c biogenesis protein ResB [Actinocorallia populi]|uniref:cytochrome c biogenesis protein ResB n=1 Tax=Actinocorallia populi TaxID=2079200 RepID=UPI000D0958FF|nr:cytochrome c biogenesis protein ResB [Actinocorallia populi]
MGLTGWLRWGWRQLTSMRTALILLFLVALASVPGSIFPQRGQSPERVVQYFEEHETLAPWLDRLSLFDVFAAPWFAAIYLLLFVSLAGCVLPRSWQLLQNVRSRPPAAPKRFGRLPQSAEFRSDETPEQVLEQARQALRKRRFRTVADDGSLAAEKGYLHEAGNLVFHLSLLALLFAVGLGAMFGYRGNLLLTEDTGFSNSVAYYGEYHPGHMVDPDDLAPFQVTLDDFEVDFVSSGEQVGQAREFTARMTYRERPGAAERSETVRVNHPLEVSGAKVYLLGHGYAPTFKVTDGRGNVVFDDAVQFLPMDSANLASEGVIKAPDAEPQQLGFQMMFWPTAAPTPDGSSVFSSFPGPLNPMVAVVGAFKGDLNMDSGDPQSVYELDAEKLEMVKVERRAMGVGETLKLPDGAGEITFTGFKEYASLTVTHDPGRVPALVAASLAVAGLVVSLMTRRRRVWVRASAGEDGRTVVEVGGLTLGTPTVEFDDLLRELRPEEPEPEPEPASAGTIKE